MPEPAVLQVTRSVSPSPSTSAGSLGLGIAPVLNVGWPNEKNRPVPLARFLNMRTSFEFSHTAPMSTNPSWL